MEKLFGSVVKFRFLKKSNKQYQKKTNDQPRFTTINLKILHHILMALFHIHLEKIISAIENWQIFMEAVGNFYLRFLIYF